MMYRLLFQAQLLVMTMAFIPIASHAQTKVGVETQHQDLLSNTDQALDIVDDSKHDVLALDDNIKALLDREVKNQSSRRQRLKQLHRILYLPQYSNIQYNASGTKTAIETFYTGGGNCISLANLFIAAARYVGLNAKYQSVRLEPEWRPRDGFFEVPGHINVVVDINRDRATIEFNAAYFRDATNNKFIKKVISDKRAKAEYFNNLAVEKLTEKDHARAFAYFNRAIDTYPKIDFLWSNLGVAYKQVGDYKQAEKSYLKALKINPKSKSTISNIYILYSEIGANTKSKVYAERAEKYARKNPYHLQRLAFERTQSQDYDEAVRLLKKAIRIHDLEPNFFHDLAVAYFYKSNIKRSKWALNKAKALAASDEYKNRYQRKLDALAANR